MRKLSPRPIGAALGLLAALTISIPAAAQETALKPIAVLAVSSYDELLQDADWLGGLMGQQVSPMIDQATGGAPGLDRTKPLGLLVTQYGLPPTVVACVPVTDMKAFFGNLAPLGVQVAESPDGMMQISAMGQSLFAKEANGWALASLAPMMLEGLPADPSADFVALTQEYDLALKVNLQNVPVEVRQQWADFIGAAARMNHKKGPDESDETFAARSQQLESQIETQKRMLTEFDQLTVGLSIDRTGGRALVDVAYSALPGSELATQMGAYNGTTTNFAGFAQDGAAASLTLAVKTDTMKPEEIDGAMANLQAQVDSAVAEDAQIKSNESRELLKQAAADFIDALRATLASGAVDGGAVLNLSPEAATVVAGGAVADPAKVESGFKKLVEVAKNEGLGMPEVSWDGQTHQGVRFHVMSTPIEPGSSPSARALLGDNVEMALGVGENSWYFALGKNWLDGVKKVIDDSAAAPGKETLPLNLTVSGTPIAQTVAAAAKMDGDEKTAMAAEMAAGALGQSAGSDHVRLVTEPIANGARMRFEVESGAIQALATAAMASQSQ